MRRSVRSIARSVAAFWVAAGAFACAGGSQRAPGGGPGPGSQEGGTPSVVQPGAPGDSTRTVDPDALERSGAPGYTAADVRFMQRMIPHHGQALEMVGLIAGRTDSEEFRKLGLRIEISQRDEIRLMERWLRERGERVTGYEPMLNQEGEARPGAGDRDLMTGMLTAGQMEELARARGVEFERLFLEHMIMHHGGAVVMVRRLLDTPGAAQGSEIFHFASEVDATQMAEIERMREMLRERSR